MQGKVKVPSTDNQGIVHADSAAIYTRLDRDIEKTLTPVVQEIQLACGSKHYDAIQQLPRIDSEKRQCIVQFY